MNTFRFTRLNPLLALLVALPMAQVAAVPLINGSFEDGLTGWELSVGGRFHIFQYASPPYDPIDPFDVPFVKNTLEAQVTPSSSYGVIDGSRAGVINNIQSKFEHAIIGPDGRPARWVEHSYTLLLSQTFDVPEGGIISGWGRLWTEDFPPYNSDKAFVTIDGVEVWKNSVEDVVKNYIGAPTLGPWEQWSATLGPGQHTIALGVSGDTEKYSTGFFDAIRVSAVPEGGCTAVLLALSFFGIIGLARTRYEEGFGS